MNQLSSSLNKNIKKNDEMRCDFNSETKLNRVKFHEHLFKMFRKL